jgi:TolA-binding protein
MGMFKTGLCKKSCLFLVLSVSSQVMADESYGDLSARIDDLEKKIKGQSASGADFATKDDLESLAIQIRELRGRIEVLEHGKSAPSPQPDAPFKPLSSLEDQSDQREAGDKGDEGDPEGDVDAILKDLGDSGAQKEAKREEATIKAEKEAPTGTLGGNNGPKAQPSAEEPKKEASRKETSKKEATKKDDSKKNSAQKTAAEYVAEYKANPKGPKAAQALLGMAATMKDKKKACVVLKKVQADFADQKASQVKAKELFEKYKCSH